MKSLKAAAIVAGALVVAGAATPAVAHDGKAVKATDLTKVVKQLTGPVQVRLLQ